MYLLRYQTMFLILTYVIPIILMTLSYAIMGRVLWGSKCIGEMTQRQLESVRTKRKVVKMFIIIVSTFGICWLPYHSYFIYVYFDPNIIFKQYTQRVYLGFYWFAMSNAMVNPLIYYWMNARFRQHFRRVICGWRGCYKNHRGDLTQTSPMLSRKSYRKSEEEILNLKRIRIDTIMTEHCQNFDIGLSNNGTNKTEMEETGRTSTVVLIENKVFVQL